jgi:hypothetical protein
MRGLDPRIHHASQDSLKMDDGVIRREDAPLLPGHDEA